MERPNFDEMMERLEGYSQDLKEINQRGNSTLTLAFVEIIRAMAWSSSQQDTNNIQIANLTDEIKTLKIITDKNAESSRQDVSSSNRLARIAIGIALATLIAQVLFSIHQEKNCRLAGSVNTADSDFVYYTGCYREFDLGLLGTYTMQLPDYRLPIHQK